MKKLLALLLALTMVLPLGVNLVAADEAPVEVEPFYLLNFAEIKEGKFDNVASCPFFWTNQQSGHAISWGGSEITGLAKRVKDLFDTRPEGLRYIRFSPINSYFTTYMENFIYMDKGAKMLQEWLITFLEEYKKIGGQLDGFMLDVEIVEMGSYYLWRDAQKDPTVFNKIVSDPRYATEIRPLLEERGFTFWPNPTEYTPEIYSISRDAGDKYANERAIWDRVMRNRLSTHINWSVCETLWRYYPEAMVSDYQTADRDGWYKFLSDTGDNSFGELTASGGNTIKVGNASNNNVYHCRPSHLFYKDSKGQIIFRNPYGYNEAIYEQTPFNMILWEANTFKNIYASTDNKTISAWLTSYNYGSERENGAANTPYTTEIIYHLGMLNPQPFLGYVVSTEYPEVPYYERLEVLSQQLKELTRVAGFADRQPIEIPANWNDSYVLSGMYAGGRNIWRITPDTTRIGLEYFQIEGDDPTFRVDGKTITFPGGKIIEDGKIDAVGSCGFWVETAKDVTPIVTTDADRYQQFPALSINFENCADGVFDYNSCQPLGAWDMKWGKNGIHEIRTVDGNKVLALQDEVTVNNIHLPANITAGDTYAENQTWEITVTVPEGLADTAEIILLNYAGTKQKPNDGGFKIQGGKLYYSTVGPLDEKGKPTLEYKELTAIKPGTYTLKRAMDFNDPENFLCTYSVLDATGKVLKAAENVAVPVFTEITYIGFSVKGADKAVLFDNYKITVTGKAADLELYDTKTGILQKDKETPRTASTTYRLSWMNATGAQSTATVKADFYEGETLKETRVIQTLTMLPGCDGVEIGMVDVAEGQSVKVYLETEEGKTGSSDKGMNIGVIAIVAAAVVAVVGVVVALVLSKPKKKPEPTAEATPEATAEPTAEATEEKTEE